MDRIIGIDYGRKRVGVAVSDPLGIFASALDTVQSAKIIEYLKKYAENEKVVLFVVGYPINMDGAPSEAAKDVLNIRFCSKDASIASLAAERQKSRISLSPKRSIYSSISLVEPIQW